MSTAPTVLFGMVPLVRAVARSADTGALTTSVTPDDSGTMFVSLTTGLNNYTLPAVSDGKGKSFIFFQADNSTTVKITSTAANIKGPDATNLVATSGSLIGDCALVIGDGTYYYLLTLGGTWTVGGS